MINASNLEKSYGSNRAVDGVSFEIPAGRTFGLLGPNGAGKTTVISMLVGLLAPDGGEVTIGGATDPTRPEVRRQIGLAPQALALYMELSAEENLAFFGRLYGLRGGALRERVNWALDFAGLEDRRRDRVGTFSGGMKRRINMAAALVHDPAVILLDEPTVGVDPQSRNHIFEKIERLKDEGRTILYTTHYMEEAARLCDRVAIMDHGKVLAIDTVQGLIEQYGGKTVIEANFVTPPSTEAATVLKGRLEGTHLRMETDTPMEDIASLTASGVAIQTMHVDQPDLEVVFLTLTGRSLRD